MREGVNTRLSAKIVDRATARKIVEAWHKNGNMVCFTNGCFDLLHFGHISSLLQTKEYGDMLVVGLNSDSSVKKYKGPSRPIQDEKTRSAVLAALECVDLVVVFEETSALELVKELNPDVIAKEGYTVDAWPEAQYVSSYGGKVVFLRREQGYSTTELVKKMSLPST